MAASDPRLATTLVSATDKPRRSIVMLHGIYGRGRNWQAIARAIVTARPEYGCWLVDLPYHGDSGSGAHGDTVTGLAADVNDWMRANDVHTAAVLGHSYGGKVALACADHPPAGTKDAAEGGSGRSPLQLWIIDSTPEAKAPSGSAWEMLALVRRLPPRFASREEAVSSIKAGGFPLGVAQWMATNLLRDDGAFVWRLDFDVMERLLLDFFDTDLWKVVESPPPGVEIHFIKATDSNAISPGAVRRIEAARSDAVHLHFLDGGHWIHAESPQAVSALLLEYLPRA